MQMSHPYENLPSDRFWRSAVSNVAAFQIRGLWKPRFRVKKRTKIATAGSCFAQHISRALVAKGYHWVDAEPAPEMMSAQAKRDFHYGTFSFRTGNIYTPGMLRQWLSWASGESEPPEVVWEKDGRFYDPFRPAVELNGFSSAQEVYASRMVTVAAVRRAIETANVFVFTLGLTESWHDKAGGFEYAICPGTVAGEFDPENHVFVNNSYASTFRHLKGAIRLARRMNRNLKILLTVSPVPLTATASGEHVLMATSHSKSILRAVAGDTKNANASVDYFPSYEIITHPVFRGMFFGPNQRTVDPKGIEFVMDSFFRDQLATFAKTVPVVGAYGIVKQRPVLDDEDPSETAVVLDQSVAEDAEAVLCEEEILNAFAK